MKVSIAIIGSGAWGTSVATVLAENGYHVKLWCFEEEVACDIKSSRINKRYLPGIILDEKIEPILDIKKAVTDVSIIFEAVPVLFLRNALKRAKPFVNERQKWCVLSKGIENKTLFLPIQIIEDVLEFKPILAALGGPNFANELAQKCYTATMIASKNDNFKMELGGIFGNNYFKTYLSNDVMGVQVGCALKNVISLFLGLLKGLEYKGNTISFLLTQGLAEIVDIAKFFGGNVETIYGLPGLGDLVLSSLCGEGRNYRAGKMLGQGDSINNVSKVMGVLPEGFNTIKSLNQIIKKNNLNVPICSGVYEIVFENGSVKDLLNNLK